MADATTTPVPFPRVEDVLGRARAPRRTPAGQPAPAAAASSAPEVDGGGAALEAVPAPDVPATPPSPYVALDPVQGASVDEAAVQAELEEMSLRALAREALRTRLLAMAIGARRRSAYEIVFLLLAFAVTVLLTAPALVQVLLAMHGTAPS